MPSTSNVFYDVAQGAWYYDAVQYVTQSGLDVYKRQGLTCVQAGSIVLAMGCREKTRANIMVPGTRPAGLYTAGAAQRLVNRQNIIVGRRVVILGSGDIGMIMARRMTLEGAQAVSYTHLDVYKRQHWGYPHAGNPLVALDAGNGVG